MQEIGNGRANEIYEANLPENYRRPNESDSYALEQFIRAKYERRDFVVRETKLKSGKKNSKVSKQDSSPPTEKKTPVNPPSEDLLSFGGPTPSSVTRPPNDLEFNAFQSSVVTQQQTFSAFQGASTTQQQTSYSAFQGASTTLQQTSYSAFQGAPAQKDLFGGGFITPTPTSQKAPKFDSESAFFSGETQQNAKPSKDSIMQLYKAPTSVSNNPLPNSFVQQPTLSNSAQQTKSTGPNYNVVMPGLGMPAVPIVNPIGVNSMGGNYYNPGANFGYTRPLPVNYVNTNGYVNANYQQVQQAKFM